MILKFFQNMMGLGSIKQIKVQNPENLHFIQKQITI